MHPSFVKNDLIMYNFPMPNAFQRSIHRILMLRPVSAILSVILHHVDAVVLYVTHGRNTLTEIVGLPVIQLFTKGAKTGKRRVIPLGAIPDGEKLILVASSFGRPRHPAWYYNLKANPECKVNVHGRLATYRAREAQGEERERYWQMALAYYAGYEVYRGRAGRRVIPVMVLELVR
jgi:deazaflavin-dependent oxidoreductase (nitroreductase family)